MRVSSNNIDFEYEIKDLDLADFGLKEISLAEHEMPGLMYLRNEYKEIHPLENMKISGSLHMTIQTAVLIETLHHLGAKLRWASCNIFSTQDHAAAGIVKNKTAEVFAWKGESIEEYWNCTLRALLWPNRNGKSNDFDFTGPDLLVDDGGDATLLIHKGVHYEKIYETQKKLPTQFWTDDDEMKVIQKLIEGTIKKNPKLWHKIAENIKGVSEETTTGVHRLIQMAEKNELLFPAINVNDSVTKSKFDNVYGCRHSVLDGILRATDVMIGGKKVLILGFGEVGKGCAQAAKGAGARVYVTEIDPICALQAAMEGFIVTKIENVIGEIDVFVTCTGNKNVIMLHHILQMKNNAIVGNIGHFDNEIDVKGLMKLENVERQKIKDQVDRFVFKYLDQVTKEEKKKGIILLAEGRLLNLGCATGHPSFVMSCSFTNQVLAQIDLYRASKDKRYENKVYLLPKELDEKVARLHLKSLGCELTQLTPEQAEYINVNVDGPYKLDTYRY